MQTRNGSSANNLGRLLRAARLSKKLTLREVAADAGVTHGNVADIELGRRNASASVLTAIAKAIGTDPKPLLAASHKLRVARLRERIARVEEEAAL